MTSKKRYRKLKIFAIVTVLLLITFFSYVEIVNRNSVNMTYRQKILKAIYPTFVWWAKLRGTNTKTLSNEKAAPAIPFYSLKNILNDGSGFDFTQLKGKKVLLVNTASDCGYTDQYEGLEKLYRLYKDKLVMIGFPANDFKEQEKGTDDVITKFCKENYGVTFLLMKKSSVVKGAAQNEIYQWLTDPAKNGWNDQQPTWNFCKYIVDENGNLTHFYGSAVEPMSKEIINAINDR